MSFFRNAPLLVGTLIILMSCGKDSKVIKEVNALMQERKDTQAMQVLQTALREDPKNVKLLRQQVLLFLHVERVSFAVTAYKKLEKHSSQDSILIDSLKNEETIIRVSAAKAIGLTKNDRPAHVKALIKAASDSEKSVRQAVVLALGDLKSPDSINVLIETLKDEDWYVRAEAALALGKFGNTQSVTALFALLSDPDSYVRKNVREALKDLAVQENKQAYLTALENKNPDISLNAAWLLPFLGDNSSLPILFEALADSENKNRRDIIRALVKSKDPSVLPHLRKIMEKDSDVKIRALAILALGELKDKEAIPTIKKLAKNRQTPPDVKMASLMALRHMTK